MTFTVGETVVYPNHGAAVIEDIEMRTVIAVAVDAAGLGEALARRIHFVEGALGPRREQVGEEIIVGATD